MADRGSMAFEQLLDKVLSEDHVDFLREAVVAVLERVMEVEGRRLIGARKGERTPERGDHRNGVRMRRWDTRVGSLAVPVPRFRKTPYTPCFMAARRRSEQALLSVVQQAYVKGVSTRKVEKLLQELGLDGVSKSEVSRVCKGLQASVEAFRTRPLDRQRYPFVWLDARYEKVRLEGRVVSSAVVIAYAVNESGVREVIGIDVGPSESEAYWRAFLRSLVKRGLRGVQLVISDAHEGLKKAIASVLVGATWQRCRVHFMRNVLSKIPKGSQETVSALLKTIFAQPTQAEARRQAAKIADEIRPRFPRAAALIDEAVEDVIAYMAFARKFWRKIHSTNPLERMNREMKRRTRVVGIFPNEESLIRLVGTLLIEQNEEWLAGRRYMCAASLAELYPEPAEATQQASASAGAM